MFLASSPQQDSLLAQLLVDGDVEPGQDGEGDHDDEDEVEPHHVHLAVIQYLDVSRVQTAKIVMYCIL